LKKRFGIRTIVNLRGREDAPEPYDVEAKWCEANGVNLVDIPMGQPGEGAERMGEFLEVVTNPAHHPVLTHCEAGSIRTGFAVAGYLIAVEGWTYDDAVRRVRKVRFKIEDPRYARYTQALKDLESGDE
jgi:protein tyrosine/serine phosphatase